MNTKTNFRMLFTVMMLMLGIVFQTAIASGEREYKLDFVVGDCNAESTDSNTKGFSANEQGSIVFYSTGNINECEYVEVTVSGGELKDPIVKTFRGIVDLPYDEAKDVSCGMKGAATFQLPPGEYTFTHKTINCTNAPYYNHTFQWRTLRGGECIKVRLTR